MSTSPTPYNLEMVSSTTSSKQINSNSRVSSTTHKSVKLASKPEKASTAANLQPKNNLKAGNARVSKAIQNEVPKNNIDINPTNYRINLTPTTQRSKATAPASVQVKSMNSAAVKNGNATSKVIALWSLKVLRC